MKRPSATAAATAERDGPRAVRHGRAAFLGRGEHRAADRERGAGERERRRAARPSRSRRERARRPRRPRPGRRCSSSRARAPCRRRRGRSRRRARRAAPMPNERRSIVPPAIASAIRIAAKPAAWEITVTGIVGTRLETSPPEKSAVPQTAADASASRTAAALTSEHRTDYHLPRWSRSGSVCLPCRATSASTPRCCAASAPTSSRCASPSSSTGLDGLVIPGGESTAFTRLMRPLRARRGDPRLPWARLRHVRRDDRARPRPPRPRRHRRPPQRVRPAGGVVRDRPRAPGRAASRCVPCSSGRRGSRRSVPGSRCWPRSTGTRCSRARGGSSSPRSTRS